MPPVGRRSAETRNRRAKDDQEGKPSSASTSSLGKDLYDRRDAIGSKRLKQAAQDLEEGKRSVAGITEELAGKWLDKLDRKGLLDQQDKNGVSTRDHFKDLDRLIEAQRRGENVRIPSAFRPGGQQADAKGASMMHLKLQIIKDLAMPRRIRQGRETLTCGPATAQSALARTAPAEYVRMVKDLATKGQTEAGGKTFKIDRRGFEDTRDGRTATEDLLQPAMVDLARREWPAKGGEGDFGGLRFGPTRRFGGASFSRNVRRFAGDEGKGEALTPRQYGGLMATIIPGNQTAVDIISEGQRRSLSRQVAAALQSGPVPVGLAGKGSSTGHAVQVLDISPSFSSFVSKGAPVYQNVTYHDPMVGEVQMSAKEFFSKVVHVTLPGRLGDELQRA